MIKLWVLIAGIALSSSSAADYPSTYDPYGRAFFTGVSLKF